MKLHKIGVEWNKKKKVYTIKSDEWEVLETIDENDAMIELWNMAISGNKEKHIEEDV